MSDDDETDPDEVEFHFSKTQRDGDEAQLPDGYKKAQITERGESETLRVVLSASQAQGWADTMAATLSSYRQQLQDSFADVDEMWLVKKSEPYGRTAHEVDGVAVTKHAAQQRKSEIQYDNPSIEVELERIPLYTE